MVLRECLPEISQSDVQIVAVDVSPVMLAKAKEAQYSVWSLRDTSPEMREKYFQRDGRNFILQKSIRSMVQFEERNLAVEDGTRWELEPYEVIFCRNVIMYLVPEGARLAVARLTAALAPAGYLFLSHAETLRGISRKDSPPPYARYFLLSETRSCGRTGTSAPMGLRAGARHGRGGSFLGGCGSSRVGTY